jgi:hypothetical protein
MVDVVYSVGLAVSVSVSVTGHTVVDRTMVSVVTEPFSGQLVTVGAHDVMVYVRVV